MQSAKGPRGGDATDGQKKVGEKRGQDETWKLQGSTAIKVKLYKSASREWRVLRVRQPRNNYRERELQLSFPRRSSFSLLRSVRLWYGSRRCWPTRSLIFNDPVGPPRVASWTRWILTPLRVARGGSRSARKEALDVASWRVTSALNSLTLVTPLFQLCREEGRKRGKAKRIVHRGSLNDIK